MLRLRSLNPNLSAQFCPHPVCPFRKSAWPLWPPGRPGALVLSRVMNTLAWAAQPRSFLELHEFLLSLDLPDATRAAWERFL